MCSKDADMSGGRHCTAKGATMKRREVLVIGGLTLIAGCSSAPANPDTKRREIDAAVDNALSQLYASSTSARELGQRARGILVFPSVTTAGFVIGASYGEGALRKTGSTAGYYKLTAGSIGLLAGAESKAMYILFMTDESLQKFQADTSGWTVGADASVAFASVGASGSIDTETAKKPIIGLARTNGGFMANLSFDGTKVEKLPI